MRVSGLRICDCDMHLLLQDADDQAEQPAATPQPAAANGVEAQPQQSPCALPGKESGTWFLPPPTANGHHAPEVSALCQVSPEVSQSLPQPLIVPLR